MTETILNHEVHYQDTGYYCAPASTRTTLGIRGIFQGENVLAGQLGTTTDGTNSIRDVTRVLNSYVGDIYRSVFIPGQTATDDEIAALKAALVKSVDSGFGLVVNIVGTGRDLNGGSHTYSGGHYIPIVGYRASGDEVLISDVAIGRNYWMTTRALAIWAAARGYSFAANAPAPKAKEFEDMVMFKAAGNAAVFVARGTGYVQISGPAFSSLAAAGVPLVTFESVASLEEVFGKPYAAPSTTLNDADVAKVAAAVTAKVDANINATVTAAVGAAAAKLRLTVTSN